MLGAAILVALRSYVREDSGVTLGAFRVGAAYLGCYSQCFLIGGMAFNFAVAVRLSAGFLDCMRI